MASNDFGKPYTYTEETYNQFLLTTIKNVTVKDESIGYLVISENANEIRTAINERKNFIIRIAFVVAIVIFIFSFVLNRYFLKPIKNLVEYTKIIKEKSKKKQPQFHPFRKKKVSGCPEDPTGPQSPLFFFFFFF